MIKSNVKHFFPFLHNKTKLCRSLIRHLQYLLNFTPRPRAHTPQRSAVLYGPQIQGFQPLSPNVSYTAVKRVWCYSQPAAAQRDWHDSSVWSSIHADYGCRSTTLLLLKHPLLITFAPSCFTDDIQTPRILSHRFNKTWLQPCKGHRLSGHLATFPSGLPTLVSRRLHKLFSLLFYWRMLPVQGQWGICCSCYYSGSSRRSSPEAVFKLSCVGSLFKLCHFIEEKPNINSNYFNLNTPENESHSVWEIRDIQTHLHWLTY